MGNKVNISSMEDFNNMMKKFWVIGTIYFYFDLERSDEIFASYLHLKGNKMIIRTPRKYKTKKIASDKINQTLLNELKPYKFVYVSNRILRVEHHR